MKNLQEDAVLHMLKSGKQIKNFDEVKDLISYLMVSFYKEKINSEIENIKDALGNDGLFYISAFDSVRDRKVFLKEPVCALSVKSVLFDVIDVLNKSKEK